MKKILFTANTLDVGGIETALVNLLNNLVNKYDITLILEKKQGIFLNELNKKINIIEYLPSNSKNVIIRKLINLLKRIKFILKYKNKFDFAASFATYSKMGSFCARTASKNNALWGHLNYNKLFESDKELYKFFNTVEFNKFKKIVFVSDEGANAFKKKFSNKIKDVLVCNNLIDYKKIKKLSMEECDFKKNITPIFLNVGRHEENQKKVSRIIEASKILQDKGMNFLVLMVGDGPDTNKYKKLVNKLGIDEKVIFLGKKKNPYPFFTIADAVILTSEYEGYPVVFVEAMTLGKPILTTDVSDAKKEINNKYGIVVENNSIEKIAEGMEQIVDFKIKQFDAEKFNSEILNKIEELINGGENA